MMRWYKFYRHKTLLIPTWWGDKSLIGTKLSYPPGFRGVRVTRSLVLYVCFVDRCCPFVLFLLAIVVSVLLRYTDSDCPFGIFKLFLPQLFYLLLFSSLQLSIKNTICIASDRYNVLTIKQRSLTQSHIVYF